MGYLRLIERYIDEHGNLELQHALDTGDVGYVLSYLTRVAESDDDARLIISAYEHEHSSTVGRVMNSVPSSK